MRYGVLADIHGNLPALERVLGRLERAGVDEYLCAGDLVGYGPFPNECVDRVAQLGAVCVAGNHDLIALGRLEDDRCGPLVKESLGWTRKVLSERSRAYLADLPLRASTNDGVVLAHGSLDDPQEYSRTPEQAALQLEVLGTRHPQSSIIVLGHTHYAWAYDSKLGTLRIPGRADLTLAEGHRYLLNPGSVGQSRERSARARFIILNLDRHTVRFEAVRYDVRRCRRALRQRGLPARSYHLAPSLPEAVAGRARRAARRLRGTRA